MKLEEDRLLSAELVAGDGRGVDNEERMRDEGSWREVAGDEDVRTSCAEGKLGQCRLTDRAVHEDTAESISGSETGI